MYSCAAVTEKALDPEVPPMLSDIHHDSENLVPQCVWSCLPSERCSLRGGHGTDIMPMEPCDLTTCL